MVDALNIQKITKRYLDGFTALKRVSFQVKKGSFFALLGPNGAGKTSLISLISQLTDPTNGSVEVLGTPIEKDPVFAKQNLGIVPQEVNVNIFLTVEQILTFNGGFYGLNKTTLALRIPKVLKQLKLWNKKDVQARFLSGGMKRRLMIARALIHEPQILLLDEPTAGVDVEIRTETWSFLKELNQQGLTILLTTHYMEEAERLCDHVVVLDQGQVMFDGRMAALLDKFDEEVVQLFFDEESQKRAIPRYLTRIDSESASVKIDRNRSLQSVLIDCNDRGVKVKRLDILESRLEKTITSLARKKR